MHRTLTGSWVLALITVATLAVSRSAAQSSDAIDRLANIPPTPKLSITGEVEFEKPADQFELSIGVVTESPEAATAVDENNKRMEAVLRALQRAGLEKNEYETGRFQVRPVYEPRPQTRQENWQPKIVGYEAVNTLRIKSKKLDQAGEIIEAANEAGANSIDSIAFTLSDPRQFRAEAIRKATANALQDARVLAEAANLKLVRILSINVDNRGPIEPMRISRGQMMAAARMPEGAAPIEAGNITIRASVNITYEIADEENHGDMETRSGEGIRD